MSGVGRRKDAWITSVNFKCTALWLTLFSIGSEESAPPNIGSELEQLPCCSSCCVWSSLPSPIQPWQGIQTWVPKIHAFFHSVDLLLGSFRSSQDYISPSLSPETMWLVLANGIQVEMMFVTYEEVECLMSLLMLLPLAVLMLMTITSQGHPCKLFGLH